MISIRANKKVKIQKLLFKYNQIPYTLIKSKVEYETKGNNFNEDDLIK